MPESDVEDAETDAEAVGGSDVDLPTDVDDIVDELRKVYDPEIPINVVDLGLIREVELRDDGSADITMTLTSPFCPVADSFKENVRLTLLNLEGIEEAEVELDFDPVWEPKQATEEGKMELQAMGIDLEQGPPGG
jgi:metal-sulfur cluster biosynthetic enzyme